ncbi:MAG: CHASE2 domain-containing protein [Richelia sp. CSU_2_1]|nr:CHASE2 domain-containing protein [Microcoleus sp. SU_5_6]NJR21193.1 CHASE2 domain-containing protein [Richelia sp. CSU_2_1]
MSKFSDKIRSVRTQLGKLFKPSLAFARIVLIASAVVTVPLIAVRQVGILESAELSAYDLMLRLRPDESPDPRLLIVGITESDIQRLRQWPISDGKIAEILQKLEAMQPRVIGLDILRDVPQGEGRSELTALLQKSDRIIGVCLVTDGSTDNPGSPPPPGISKDSFGFADFSVDRGGILRRALLFMKPPAIDVNPSEKHPCNDSSEVLFSFNLRLALRYLQSEGINPKLDANQSLWLGSTQIKQLADNEGGYKNADVRGYQVLINYRSRRQPANQVRLTDVLEGKIDPNLVKDKIVLIGYTTETVKDLFYTPYSAGKQKNQFMPGIVAHAQVVSQLLSAVLDQRPLFWFWPEWAEILWISGWSIVGGTLAWRIAHPARLALAYLAMLGVCCGISFGIFLSGGWLPAVAPSLALIVTGSSIVSADRFNKSAYGQAISKKVKQVFKIEINEQQKDDEVEEVLNKASIEKLKKVREEFKTSHKEAPATEPYQIPELNVGSPEPSKAQTSPEDLSPELAKTQSLPEDFSPATVGSSDSSKTQSMPEDYLAQLHQKAKEYKHRSPLVRSNHPQTDVPTNTNGSPSSGETQPDEDLERSLQAKAQKIRERREAAKREARKSQDLPETED